MPRGRADRIDRATDDAALVEAMRGHGTVVPDSSRQHQDHHAGGPGAGGGWPAGAPPMILSVPDRGEVTAAIPQCASTFAPTSCWRTPPKRSTAWDPRPTPRRSRPWPAEGPATAESRSCCSSPAARMAEEWGLVFTALGDGAFRRVLARAPDPACSAAAKGSCPTSCAARKAGSRCATRPTPGIARLVASLGEPLTSTSANRPGGPPAPGADRLVELFARGAQRRTAGARRRRARQRAAVDAGGLHRTDPAHGAGRGDTTGGATTGGRETAP